jgi:hypothetical protein
MAGLLWVILWVIFWGYIVHNTSKIYILCLAGPVVVGAPPRVASTPCLSEARPAAMPSEGLSGRRGAPTGAKVRGVTSVIFLMLSTKYDKCNSVEALLLINPYKQYNPKT